MKITQYMEPMLLCTAFYLLIRVTFSTPTDAIANQPPRPAQPRVRRLLGERISVVIAALQPRLRLTPADAEKIVVKEVRYTVH